MLVLAVQLLGALRLDVALEIQQHNALRRHRHRHRHRVDAGGQEEGGAALGGIAELVAMAEERFLGVIRDNRARTAEAEEEWCDAVLDRGLGRDGSGLALDHSSFVSTQLLSPTCADTAAGGAGGPSLELLAAAMLSFHPAAARNEREGETWGILKLRSVVLSPPPSASASSAVMKISFRGPPLHCPTQLPAAELKTFRSRLVRAAAIHPRGIAAVIAAINPASPMWNESAAEDEPPQRLEGLTFAIVLPHESLRHRRFVMEVAGAWFGALNAARLARIGPQKMKRAALLIFRTGSSSTQPLRAEPWHSLFRTVIDYQNSPLRKRAVQIDALIVLPPPMHSPLLALIDERAACRDDHVRNAVRRFVAAIGISEQLRRGARHHHILGATTAVDSSTKRPSARTVCVLQRTLLMADRQRMRREFAEGRIARRKAQSRRAEGEFFWPKLARSQKRWTDEFKYRFANTFRGVDAALLVVHTDAPSAADERERMSECDIIVGSAAGGGLGRMVYAAMHQPPTLVIEVGPIPAEVGRRHAHLAHALGMHHSYVVASATAGVDDAGATRLEPARLVLEIAQRLVHLDQELIAPTSIGSALNAMRSSASMNCSLLEPGRE